MSQSPKYNLTLTTTDKASRPVAQAMAKMKQEQAKAARDNERNKKAAATLGIRTEQQIRAEQMKTLRAFGQLQSSGTAGANTMSRAYDAAKNHLHKLNAELGKTNTELSRGEQIGYRIGRGIRGAGEFGVKSFVAYKAVSHIIRDPITKAMDYDKSLAVASNTAFSERDAKGRIEGKKELDAAVRKALKEGGSREGALTGLNTMMASGALPANVAMDMLPLLQKASVGTQAPVEDLADIIISAIQQFGIKPEEMGKVFDMAIKAGEAGQFELSDMAKWLSKQMAAGKKLGMKGLDDFGVILRSDQQSAITAGTRDEAGNNLTQLLLKIGSRDTERNFERYKYTDPKDGKVKGINLRASMNERFAKGMNPIDAFIDIIDTIIPHDKEYEKLSKELNAAQGEDKKEVLERMLKYAEGTIIGKLVADQGALMALLGIRENKKYGEEVSGEIKASEGALQTSYVVVSSTDAHNADDAKNTFEMLTIKAFEPVAKALGDLGKWFSKFANKNEDAAVKATQAGYLAMVTGAIWTAFKAGGKVFGTGGGAAAGTGAGAGAGTAGATGAAGVATRSAGLAMLARAFGWATLIEVAGSGYASPERRASENRLNTEAEPYVNQMTDERGQDFAIEAYDLFGPMSFGKGAWKYAAPEQMKKYMEQYEELWQLIQQHGEEAIKDSWESTRPYFSSKNWKKQSPQALKDSLETTRRVRLAVDGSATPSNMQLLNPYATGSSTALSGTQLINPYARPELPPLPDMQDYMPNLNASLEQFAKQVRIPVSTEVIVNLTGILDRQVLFETIERVVVNDLNRGS